MAALLGCQTGTTVKAGSHLHPRYKQIKDMRLFEGIINEQFSGLKDQTRLSILSRNAGSKRGKVTNKVLGCFQVICKSCCATV